MFPKAVSTESQEYVTMLGFGRYEPLRPSRGNRFLLTVFFAFLLLSYPSQIHAQDVSRGTSDCDPGLKKAEGNPPNAYAQRKERCEGIYAREIAGTNLGVISFTRQFDDFDPQADAALRLNWSAPVSDTVHIRAVSLRSRFFYRMDAMRPRGSSSWTWPTDILKELGLDRPGLGIVATTTVSLNGIKRDMYLPLRISPKMTTQPNRPYEILLRSDVELSEVFVSITQVDRQGKVIKNLRQSRPLLYGVYPAERGIPIHLESSELNLSTIYRVDVGALLRTGGSANMSFWIYGGT